MKGIDQRSHPSEADQDPGTAAEPRWPALVAALAVAGIYGALPASLSAGPRWLALVITAILLVPSVLTHRSGRHNWNRIVGYCITGVLTAFMIWSLVLLVRALPAHKESPIALLRSGATLWISNVLVFALWYWRLDAGGPYSRGLRPGHTEGAFLFRLPVSGLQHQYGFFADRCADPVALGEDHGDDSGADFPDRDGDSGGAGGEYSVRRNDVGRCHFSRPACWVRPSDVDVKNISRILPRRVF